MTRHPCPFPTPLITHRFGCNRSQEVIRRGGTEIACQVGDSSARCIRLFGCLKAAALPAFGVEDDLLSMPHSVQVKIQHGGPLGLQQLLSGDSSLPERIEDLDHLVAEVVARFDDHLPCEAVLEAMLAFKPRARRGR